MTDKPKPPQSADTSERDALAANELGDHCYPFMRGYDAGHARASEEIKQLRVQLAEAERRIEDHEVERDREFERYKENLTAERQRAAELCKALEWIAGLPGEDDSPPAQYAREALKVNK